MDALGHRQRLLLGRSVGPLNDQLKSGALVPGDREPVGLSFVEERGQRGGMTTDTDRTRPLAGALRRAGRRGDRDLRFGLRAWGVAHGAPTTLLLGSHHDEPGGQVTGEPGAPARRRARRDSARAAASGHHESDAHHEGSPAHRA